MSLGAKFLSIIVAFFIFIFVFNLVRGKKLKESYSVIWIGMALIMLSLAIWTEPLFFICRLFKISNAVSLVLLLMLLFVILYFIHISICITTLSNNIKELTYSLSLLKKELEEIITKNENNKKEIY